MTQVSYRTAFITDSESPRADRDWRAQLPVGNGLKSTQTRSVKVLQVARMEGKALSLQLKKKCRSWDGYVPPYSSTNSALLTRH